MIRALLAANACFARMYHRVEVYRRSQLPRTGPAILVCNHTSGLDPALIQCVCNRPVRWMMAREYFDIKPMQWLFNTVGVILVQRTGRDMAATRQAMQALEAGYVLGVFPEGRIETSRELLPFQNGIGLMAIKTGAPVYPAYLDGTQRGREMLEAIFLPNHASISFGPKVEFTQADGSKHQIVKVTEQIQQAVLSLQKEHRPRDWR
jgi:1-acyl-sn-glycerol-3-phosphate acyltransferase